MSVSVSKDPNRPAGYAWIDVMSVLPAGDVVFRIERNHPALPHLGTAGWQASPATLRPISVKPLESVVRFEVGPDVVNEIGEYEQIKFFLPAIRFEGQVVWPPIPPLNQGRRQSIVNERARKTTVETTIAGGSDDKPATTTTTGPTPPLPPVVVDPETTPVKTHRGRWAALIAACFVLIAVVAAGTYWRNKPSVTAPAVPPIASPPASPEQERPWQVVVRDPNSDGAALYELGLKLAGATPPNWDGALEAMIAAETRRNSAAALWIGRAYDPRKEIWQSMFGEANPNNAMRHYMTAKDAGSADGATEITGLCEWLESRKNNGSGDEKRAHQNYCAN